MGSVKFLSVDCGSKIRQGQVISTVSDVVRELVDNAIDAGAKAIHIFLENFGTKKIEVRDSGRGISEADVPNIFKGGYTSKLKDEKHLSCGDFYGFRGEALSSICGLSGVILTTKTESERGARKYVISKTGKFPNPYLVPAGTGTSIVVENLFKDYPVRQKHATSGKTPTNELKVIEAYLKSVALANPAIHFMLYHNSQTIWTKPVTKNAEHALTAVLGVPLARSLSKPIVVDFDLAEHKGDQNKFGSLQVFLPKPPVDMRAVGSTSNQNTIVLINRRRIFDTQFEQLVKRYVIASADQPTNAEQRKFPACLVSLTVVSSEVDFNRETNKAKVFLKQKDLLLSILENVLKKFYSIDLSVIPVDDDDPFSMAQPMILTQNEQDTSAFTESIQSIQPPHSTHTHSVLHTNVSTPEKRQQNIQSFLNGLARPKPLMSLDVNPVVESETSRSSFNRNCPSSPSSVFLKTSIRENLLEKTSKSSDSGCGTGTSPISPVVPSSRGSSNSEFQDSTSLKPFDFLAATSVPSAPNLGFGETDPLCNVIIHNDPWLQGRSSLQGAKMNSSEVPSVKKRRSFEPFSPVPTPETAQLKRPKLFDTEGDRLIQTPKLQTPVSRQTTLQELPSWQTTFGSTPKQRKNSLRQASLFESIDEMNRNLVQIPSTSHLAILPIEKVTVEPAVFNRRDGDGLSVISVRINMTRAITTSSKTVSSHSTGDYDASVIRRLDTSDIFIVKIDGLVGAFHASRFLRFFPQLMDPEHFRFDSDEYVLKLVIEFTKCWESIPPDDAVTVFHVLADTEDMDRKYAAFYPY